MNLIVICVVFINFLLFNGYLTANIDRDSFPSGEVQQQNTTENRTKIGAFNEDFEYAIFDSSDLFQILQLAKDPRYSEFVKKHIFSVKYPNYGFYILASNLENDPQPVEDSVSSGVYMYGHNFYLDVIKHFGESMRKLSFYNVNLVNDDRATTILRYMNEYCSDSLTFMYLGTINGISLTQFQKPFTKLVELSFYLGTNRIGSFQRLNGIFPNLYRLDIYFYESTEVNQNDGNRYIESEFPQMENLRELQISSAVHNASDLGIIHKQLGNLIENNPQIQRFIYNAEVNDFIQVINDKLPNLEFLSISSLDADIQPVHFDHVKCFSVGTAAARPFERLSFSNLDTIAMTYPILNETARDSWIQFFKNHQNTRKLNCTLHGTEGIVEFLAELPSFEEIVIEDFADGNFDLINRLLFENQKNYSKFQYATVGVLDERDMAFYREEFGNQWHITNVRNNWSILTFERKTFD